MVEEEQLINMTIDDLEATLEKGTPEEVVTNDVPRRVTKRAAAIAAREQIRAQSFT
jgi:hypothetical protein